MRTGVNVRGDDPAKRGRGFRARLNGGFDGRHMAPDND